MTQHTPGPWEVAANRATVTGLAVSGPGGLIAATPHVTRFEGQAERFEHESAERHANARLIAAAPDLLAELKLCEEMLCEASRFVPRTGLSKARADHIDARISAVRAAIAEAEGRS